MLDVNKVVDRSSWQDSDQTTPFIATFASTVPYWVKEVLGA